MHSISNNNVKARKKHICNAWEFINQHKNDNITDGSRDDGYKCQGIKPGDTYNRQVNVDGGDLWTFKQCQSCEKYASERDVDMTGDK